MQGLAVVSARPQSSTKLNAGKIKFNGELEIRAPALALETDGLERRVYDDLIFESLEQRSVSDLLEHYYMDRNETVHYEHSSQVIYDQIDKDTVELHLKMRIPEQEFIYIPGFWSELKFAWAKYFAIALLLYLVLYRLFMNIVITSSAFDTV